MNRKQYTPEQQIDIVKNIQKAKADGWKLPQACKANGISTFTFYEWQAKHGLRQRKYERHGSYALTEGPKKVALTRAERNAEITAQWERHFTAWEQSGLTQKEYAEKEGFKYGSFMSAFNRARKRAVQTVTPAPHPTRDIVVEKNGDDAKTINALENEILNLKVLLAEYALDVKELKVYIGRT